MAIKKITYILIFSLIALHALVFAEKAKIPESADFWSDYPAEELGGFLISKMTDEELLAQIFMFGWEGIEPSGHIMEVQEPDDG